VLVRHYYTTKEIDTIRKNFHNTLTILSQFQKINIDEETAMRNFLSANFKIGSIEDPLLDCFGTAIMQYKFKTTVPIKRINPMENNINNLPHIMDAEVVKQTPVQSSNEVTINGKICSITYGAKPSSKKPGKAIVSVTIAYGEEAISYKNYVKIEQATDNVLSVFFANLLKYVDMLFHFNVSLEETDDSKKGVFNAKFEAKEVETYCQWFEIEPVEAEINFAKVETLSEFLAGIIEATSEYSEVLESIEAGKTKLITIVKGGKNNIEYLSNERPSVCGNLIELTGNMSSEDLLTSSLDVKSVTEHVFTEEDLEEMSSVICSDYEVSEEDEGSEDASDEIIAEEPSEEE